GPVPETPRKRQPCRVASAATDRRRRRYTCRGARSTAAAPLFENCAGATWPGGAPLLRPIFYSPRIPSVFQPPHPPPLSTRAPTPPGGPSAVVESKSSGSRPLAASTAHAMHGWAVASDRDHRRRAVASPLASSLATTPSLRFALLWGLGTSFLSHSSTPIA
ncbi:hypothetical protein BAE44_0008755, partial [Dichanthelium oligosanthes]